MMLDHTQLKDILPQAAPFLMLDYVEEYTPQKSLTAVKNITSNEWPFEGGLKTDTFPETLLIEAAAQAALVLYHVSKVKEGGRRPRYALGRVKAECFGEVSVGDQVRFNVSSGKLMEDGGYSDIDILVDTDKKATVEIIYKVRHLK